MNNLLTPSCRMAFAALIHDIGKFAERAKIDISPEVKEKNVHIFCPFHNDGKYYTHIHAAYTGIAIDLIEKHLPPIKNADTFPFQEDSKDNSIISAAARHHRPETYLQHIISTADRLSSAFERTKYEEYNKQKENENYQQARLIPLFDKLFAENNKTDFKYRYSLETLSPVGIFPHLKENIVKDTATDEYKKLWDRFTEDIKKIHNKDDWSIFLDNFDSLYVVYTQNIPSSSYKTLSDVSLYDHSKSTAALATALWRYHYETKTETKQALKEDTEKKFLLIQGDISGIQDFIFETGTNTRKNAYKLLRGRSFMISLFSECAALKILDILGLPTTSQIINAAGKFVIVAPNTLEVKNNLNHIKQEFNYWFKQEFYGLVTVGISTLEATQADFENKKFKSLQTKIFESLSVAKMQKFDLCNQKITFDDFFTRYEKTKKLCCFDGKMPAEELVANTEDDYTCKRCADIILLSEHLTRQQTIYISHKPIENGLKTDVLGYYIGWKKAEELVRIWDISLPNDETSSLFKGYARRFINAYVPKFSDSDANKEVYKRADLEAFEIGQPKTFSHLAVENCIVEDDKLKTKPALMCLKGDIDNLGHILQNGFKDMTFATMAGLSRQINNFFSVWLPYLCQSDIKAKNIYTVFAGGDDFYLIGPWLDMIKIIPVIREKFKEYVCNNVKVTFSAGMCMTRSGDDAVNMSEMAEKALENAKNAKNGNEEKNAICCFNQTVSYDEFSEFLKLAENLDNLYLKYKLSVSYIYSLLTLCEDAEKADKNFKYAMWRSKLVYRTRRFVETNRNITDENKDAVADLITEQIGGAIAKYKEKYKISLSIWLYQHREN